MKVVFGIVIIFEGQQSLLSLIPIDRKAVSVDRGSRWQKIQLLNFLRFFSRLRWNIVLLVNDLERFFCEEKKKIFHILPDERKLKMLLSFHVYNVEVLKGTNSLHLLAVRILKGRWLGREIKRTILIGNAALFFVFLCFPSALFFFVSFFMCRDQQNKSSDERVHREKNYTRLKTTTRTYSVSSRVNFFNGNLVSITETRCNSYILINKVKNYEIRIPYLLSSNSRWQVTWQKNFNPILPRAGV